MDGSSMPNILHCSSTDVLVKQHCALCSIWDTTATGMKYLKELWSRSVRPLLFQSIFMVLSYKVQKSSEYKHLAAYLVWTKHPVSLLLKQCASENILKFTTHMTHLIHYLFYLCGVEFKHCCTGYSNIMQVLISNTEMRWTDMRRTEWKVPSVSNARYLQTAR